MAYCCYGCSAGLKLRNSTQFRLIQLLECFSRYVCMLKAAVLKLCFADPKEILTITQGIRGFFSVMATLKFIVY